MNENTELAKEILSDVLELPACEIDDDATMVTTPQWDSFAHLELCEAVAQRLGTDVSTDMIDGCSTVAGVAKWLATSQ